jgi:hypothetical protein
VAKSNRTTWSYASRGVLRTQLFRRLKERSVLQRVTVVPSTPEHMAKRREFARPFVEKFPGKNIDCLFINALLI